MKQLIGIYGAAGCGRGIMPLVRFAQPHADLVFIDDRLTGTIVNGYLVLGWDQFLNRPTKDKSACLAIANSAIREKLAIKCDLAGVRLCSARAANVVELDEVEIGDGACLSPFVTLTSNIVIGRAFHANLYSYIEHDCRVGDFVTLAPGAKVNGNVTLEDHAYIGSGAVIRQGIFIGKGAVVGMGAIVTRDVSPGDTVIGNPARIMQRD